MESSDDDGSYSTASECDEEEEESEKDGGDEEKKIRYDWLDEYSEFVVKDPSNIRLEYLIQCD